MEPFKLKEKIYDMILYGSPALEQFPKSERFLLAADIRSSMYELLRYSIILEKRYYKKNTIEEMDIELDKLRHMVRMAADKRLYPNRAPCLHFRKYEYWAKLLDEIGKMIGGYKKSTS